MGYTYIDDLNFPGNMHAYYYIVPADQYFNEFLKSKIVGLRNSEYSWDENLYLTDDGNNRPKLIWGPHPNYYYADIIGYKLYYSLHQYANPPGSFSLLATFDENTFEYIHSELNLGGGYDGVSYYITTLYSDESRTVHESSVSNIVTGRLSDPFKLNSEETLNNYSYKLLQNYPNPFNPVTNIKYQIKEKGFVTIKIYDILGKEIVTLVNENKEAGDYSVDFSTGSIGDGRSLPSGVYIYSIIINDYYQNRKMSLVK